MYRHLFRKSFGLIILYCSIIIGIFVIQFRSESVVSKNTGALSVSFAQTRGEEGEATLKNFLQARFKGISFIADEANPVCLVSKNEKNRKNLTLISYELSTPLAHTFHFSEGASLTFAASDTTPDASLTVSAVIPKDSESLLLSYKPTPGFSVTEKTRTRLTLSSKNSSYRISAAEIQDETIVLSQQAPTVSYVFYDPTVEFSFASIDSGMIIAQKESFDANISTFRASVVSSVATAIQNSQKLSEKSIIAYISELASRNRYAEAIAYIPESFKNGNKRTFLSAPYFNSLTTMYPSLTMNQEHTAEMISNAVNSPSLSIFTTEYLADYIVILPHNRQQLEKLLLLPAQILDNGENALSLAQATGIIRTYLRLEELHSQYAELLLESARKCLSIIESCCVLTDTSLSLVEKDIPVSNILTLETGMALITWGNLKSSESDAADCKKAGYAMVNTVLAGNHLDAFTMAEAYPILVHNSYYPHYEIFTKSDGSTAWAWTCASKFTLADQNNQYTISIQFVRGESHYVIMGGIEPFSEIEIYGLSFRSDPRFESYNSSGFVYRENSKTLLLKSRHKTAEEIIRLLYPSRAKS